MKKLECYGIEKKTDNTYWLSKLLELAVPEKFVSKELDCFSLYQKLLIPMTKCTPALVCKEAWQIDALSGDISPLKTYEYLRDNLGSNLAHYAVWSGNVALMERVKMYYPHLFELTNNNNCGIAHFAALSGNPQTLAWVKNHYPQCVTLVDKNNCNIANDGAIYGHISILDWVLAHCPALLLQKDLRGNNIAHHAVLYCHPPVLDWILKHYPELLIQKNNSIKNILSIAVNENNTVILNWILQSFPQLFREKYHRHIEASPQSFIIWGLCKKKRIEIQNWIEQKGSQIINQENSSQFKLFETSSARINNQLLRFSLEAIKTNYRVTSLPADRTHLLNDSQAKIFADTFARNLCIIKLKASLIVFLQGLKQNACLLSQLPQDIIGFIFKCILPDNTKEDLLYNNLLKPYMDNAQRKSFHSEKALSVIENEISRLEKINNPFQKEHAENKISAFSQLKTIVNNFQHQMSTATFKSWSVEHMNMMSKPERAASTFFQTDENQSIICVNTVINLLNSIYNLDMRNNSCEYNNGYSIPNTGLM